ncbi:30S ribosomal protein S3 [Alkalispirochaeta sphaeroplastigenens]|uniref:Small ribosomal subunit protein uS3 n=1 Tax=Alkalispirochaeta sphaeroplastigenens TaxID=1187066 RepID=A0A2S4JGX9_9SPIO|nr:30S ribosomal protein S3 [Alkalispirochaeta sphaeroplastigenens]POQ98763.1 30S ribosomal protein S3 [Alkalispirochaeta sphaeroplastigenens]
MGQKVNPYGMRLGINKTWRSKWYVDPREYADTLHEDLHLRKVLNNAPETKGADIAEVEIIRHPQRITLVIHTSRPGVIIGTKGSNIEKIGTRLQKVAGKKIQIKIKEIKRPETHAQVVALNIARQLKSRGSFRRTLKMAVNNAMKGGIQGVKVHISGRLGGAEMSRSEQQKAGRVPLHTLRANIDYGFAEALTTFGTIGVKVWMFHGEVLSAETKQDAGAVVRKNRRERSGARSSV